MAGLRFRGWQIWYKDGTHVTSREHRRQDIPRRGFIMGLAFFHEKDRTTHKRYRNTVHGTDYYVLGDGFFFETLLKPEEAKARYPGATILAGAWTTDEKFKRVFDYAVKGQRDV